MKRTTKRKTQFIEVAVPATVEAGLAAQGSTRIRGYRSPSGVSVLVTLDLGQWHLSISAHGRYPTWDEIADARYALCPDYITMALLLPPPWEYVNLHENTFHLHQIEGDA